MSSHPTATQFNQKPMTRSTHVTSQTHFQKIQQKPSIVSFRMNRYEKRMKMSLTTPFGNYLPPVDFLPQSSGFPGKAGHNFLEENTRKISRNDDIIDLTDKQDNRWDCSPQLEPFVTTAEPTPRRLPSRYLNQTREDFFQRKSVSRKKKTRSTVHHRASVASSKPRTKESSGPSLFHHAGNSDTSDADISGFDEEVLDRERRANEGTPNHRPPSTCSIKDATSDDDQPVPWYAFRQCKPCSRLCPCCSTG